MKHYGLIIFGLILTMSINAQSLSEKVALKTCECLDTLNTIKQIEDSLRICTSRAMTQVMAAGTYEEKSILSTVEGIKGVFQEVNELIPSYCYNVRRLIIEEKNLQFNKLSTFSKANEHYSRGNDFMNKADYVNSIKEFKKAIKIDKDFVFAYDNLAISFRKQENYKKAIKYYKKSLEIFPEGDVALLNIAVAFSVLKDYDNSLKYYKEMIFLYPDNPEGYLGTGRMQFIKTDYANALENIFIAHRIYVETNSEYKNESEQLIGIMYSELKDKGKIDLFNEKAGLHNFSINE